MAANYHEVHEVVVPGSTLGSGQGLWEIGRDLR